MPAIQRMRWSVVCALPLLSACHTLFGLVPVGEEPPDAPSPPATWSAITTGATHSCAIRELDATLWCWGRNELGQLALGSAIHEVAVPTRVDDAAWSSVSTSAYTTCGIRTDRSLWCWGFNAFGQVGNGTTVTAVPTPNRIAGSWLAVRVGSSHSCALDEASRAWCWGYGERGELGTGTAASSSTPQPLGDRTWASLAVGAAHTCGIATDDSLWCWGRGGDGALGIGPASAIVATPTRVGLETWYRVAAGELHTCGVRRSGELMCWGTNDRGQLGVAAAGVVQTPLLVDDATEWRDLFGGWHHTCGLGADGLLRCWGGNERGATGASLDNAITPSPTVVASGAASYVTASAGPNSTCAVAADLTAWCMGQRAHGMRGDGVGSVTLPTKLDGQWRSVNAGYNSTCAINVSGRLHCWGDNIHGKLGDGTSRARQVPQQTGNPTDTWLAASVGREHSCGLLESKALACWGWAEFGQLGIGTMPVEMRTPQRVTHATGAGWTMVATDGHTCAIDDVSKLWCWGPNSRGELGTNNTNIQLRPARVEMDVTWSAVDLGRQTSCGIVQSLSTLRCWGDNSEGQAGNGTVSASPQPTPLDVVGVSVPSEVFVGSGHVCVRDGATTKCWGRNGSGQLGVGDQGAHLVPTALDGNWSELALGSEHSCGIDQGTLWCWGSNLYGEAATRDLTGFVRVQRINDETDWRQVAAGGRHNCAVKTDETLWCWGNNQFGQLGLGTAWDAEMTAVGGLR